MVSVPLDWQSFHEKIGPGFVVADHAGPNLSHGFVARVRIAEVWGVKS